ncbi:MAG: hypothetical protein H6722_33420 [Sandaracinus sp.]|nr:hypothetical protein [Sandaracinus sp.]
MKARVRIGPWATLPIGTEPVRSLVEQLSSREERRRFDRARKTPPAVPPGLSWEGDAGDLETELSTLLECPRVGEALSVTFVPFSINGFDDPYESFEVDTYASPTGQVHRHAEGHDLHLLVDAELLEARWLAAQEDDINFGLRVDEATSSAGAEPPLRGLWRLVELVEKFLPVSRRLGLPLVVEWLDRERLAESHQGFEQRLEDRLFGVFGVTPDPDPTITPEDPVEPSGLGVVVLAPFSNAHVDVLAEALERTARDYGLEATSLRVALSTFRTTLVVHLRTKGFDGYALHTNLDLELDEGGGAFGASLSGQLSDALPDALAPSAWTVLRAPDGPTLVHEGFVYTYEGTDESADALARLAGRLGVSATTLESVLREPDLPFAPLVELDTDRRRQLRQKL